MRIDYVVSSISRCAGGVSSSVRSLSLEMIRVGCSLKLFSGEDECSKDDQHLWRGVPIAIFQVIGPSSFGYQPGLAKSLQRSDSDVIHSHGLWMYPSVAVSKLGRLTQKPYVISPHGMLDPWALGNSSWKKRLAGMLYEKRHLHAAACIHALCESEYESIRKYGLKNPVAIVPNGVDRPASLTVLPRPQWLLSLPENSKILLFLGRIHPKKGLINLLHGWAILQGKNHQNTNLWHLVVAGWDQGGHLSELNDLAVSLGVEESVHFIGSQFGLEKEKCLQYADALILPSLSEGLPMTVLEAWTYGLPVLMTQECNLPEGFSSRAALEIRSSTKGIVDGLTQLVEMSDHSLARLGENGRELAERKFAWKRIANRMIAIYAWLLGQGDCPADVRLK